MIQYVIWRQKMSTLRQLNLPSQPMQLNLAHTRFLASSVKIKNFSKWVRRKNENANLVRLIGTRKAGMVVKRRTRLRCAATTIANWITSLVTALSQKKYTLASLYYIIFMFLTIFYLLNPILCRLSTQERQIIQLEIEELLSSIVELVVTQDGYI